MVEVDRPAIARTAKAMGGEGTTLLLLEPAATVDNERLDAALPEDHGDGPANGGWFPGPTGWLLLVEGLDEEVGPWIDDLATRLTDGGVVGTLTGAGTVGQPQWVQGWDHLSLYANLGFRPEPGFDLYSGWVCGHQASQRAITLGMDWIEQHAAKVVAVADLRARFWADRNTAARTMTADLAREGRASAASYHQQRREVREAFLARPAEMMLVGDSDSDVVSRLEIVDDLRSALLAAPLVHLSIATISHRPWSSMGTDDPGPEDFDAKAYRWHPELWDQFTGEPCGIQLLTGSHLARANDLSAWSTRRLDDGHFLVEARDLDPWFAAPRRTDDPLDPELTQQARQDFGDMVLTRRLAAELGVNTKPPRAPKS